MYQIHPYTYEKARHYGVSIKPSVISTKKIDVFRDGKKIASIGDIRYSDFPTYWRDMGKAYADERRRLYKLRHQSTRMVVDSPSYWADRLLW